MIEDTTFILHIHIFSQLRPLELRREGRLGGVPAERGVDGERPRRRPLRRRLQPHQAHLAGRQRGQDHRRLRPHAGEKLEFIHPICVQVKFDGKIALCENSEN